MLNRKNNPARSSSGPNEQMVQRLRNEVQESCLDLHQLIRTHARESHLYEIVRNHSKSSTEEGLTLEVIFFTATPPSNEAEAIFEWLGFDTTPSLEALYHSHVELPSSIFDSPANFICWHYLQIPAKPIIRKRPHIRILFYDEYTANNKDLSTLLQMHSLDTAVCFLISLEEHPSLLNYQYKLYANAIYVEPIHFAEVQLDLAGYLEEKSSIFSGDTLSLYNQLHEAYSASRVLDHLLANQRTILMGKKVITQMRSLQNQAQSLEVSGTQIQQLKSDLQKQFRRIARALENRIQKQEIEKRKNLEQIQQEIEGFNSPFIDNSKSHSTIKLPVDFLHHIRSRVRSYQNHLFSLDLEFVKEAILQLEKELKFKLSQLGVTHPVFPSQLRPASSIEEFVDHGIVFDKDYEKQVPRKGISQLISEIRAPLFMIMPLFMMFMIVVSLWRSTDGEAQISGNKIVINKMPSGFQFNNEFIDQFSRKIVENSGLKDKFILEEGGRGNSKVIKHDVPSGTVDQTPIVLYFNETVSAREIESIIKDKRFGLLEGRDGGNAQSIYNFLEQFYPYRWYVSVIVLLALFWLVYKKKKDFDKETQEVVDKELRLLKINLKQDMSRLANSLGQKWKTLLLNQVNDQQGVTLQVIDNTLVRNLNNRKDKTDEQLKQDQKRINLFQADQRELEGINSQHQKLMQRLNRLKSTFRNTFSFLR